MSTEYTGLRAPRDEDINKWKKYFEINPTAKKKYPDMYEKVSTEQKVIVNPKELEHTAAVSDQEKSIVEKIQNKPAFLFERIEKHKDQSEAQFIQSQESRFKSLEKNLKNIIPEFEPIILNQDEIVLRRIGGSNKNFSKRFINVYTVWNEAAKRITQKKVAKSRIETVSVKAGDSFFSRKYATKVFIEAISLDKNFVAISFGSGNLSFVSVSDLEKMDLQSYYISGEDDGLDISVDIKIKTTF